MNNFKIFVVGILMETCTHVKYALDWTPNLATGVMGRLPEYILDLRTKLCRC